MARDKLTATQVAKARPDSSTTKLFDGGGLYLEVAPSGSRYWRMKYRFLGREKRLAFGVYPAVSLAEARRRREVARAQLATGVDPGAAAKAAKARALAQQASTFQAAADDWLRVRRPGWTPLQFDKERKRLENHAFPWIGSLPIGDVGVPEVRGLLERIVRAGHVEQAHRLREQLSRVFRHAVANEWAAKDPAHALRDSLPPRVYRRYATMTDPEQVAELLRAIDGFSGTFPVRCALRLAPLLFCRPGELRGARWDEFHLHGPNAPKWVIPAARRKLKKAIKEHPDAPEHVVPLSRQALAILDELRPLTGRSEFLFPGVRNPKAPISNNTINAGLRRLGYGKDDMTGHGFRHLASTLLNELGHSKDAIERQLSHKEPGVAGVYNLSQLLPERTRMMQEWADYLDQLRTTNAN
jgi:integrase